MTIAIGLVLLLVLIFGTGSKSNTKNSSKPEPVKAATLTDYVTSDSKMTLTVSGMINGDDIHRSIRISVDANDRQLEVIQGYQNNVIQRNNFVNNMSAYDSFVHALARTGFGKVRKTSETEERGVCATGQRYTFDVTDKGKSVSHTWAGTCTRGTSLARAPEVLQLFRAQITGYSKLTSGVNLAAN
jgi:hypothetical protein